MVFLTSTLLFRRKQESSVRWACENWDNDVLDRAKRYLLTKGLHDL